ncbi:MAG: hypothetical protein ACLTG4_02725 [Oscillospiraceae bacterium]
MTVMLARPFLCSISAPPAPAYGQSSGGIPFRGEILEYAVSVHAKVEKRFAVLHTRHVAAQRKKEPVLHPDCCRPLLSFLCERFFADVPFEPVDELQKLLPKERRFVFRDPFADGDDGDPIFHVVSSKIRFGGLGSVNPPYTTHFHKNHPFFSYSGT